MVDFSRAIGAEVREVVEREHQGKPARVVIAARTYDTDAEDLWDALTEKERIPRWFAPVEGELKPGCRYQVQGNAGGAITRCERPEAFEIYWELGGVLSWVTVRLTPEGTGTRLTLEHILPVDALKDEHWAQYGPGAVGVGWELSFLGLGLHLETGGDVAVEANATWMASDEAKTFMRDSAAAWGEAHIAGGEDPEVAPGMAERTAAAYAGG